MQYKELRDFPKSLQRLWRKGGPYQKAADTVSKIVGRVTTGADNPFVGVPTTKHGETRIPKCVKYDLTGYARLVTIQDSGVVLFCFAGDHDEEERWLDANRGLTLAKAGNRIIEARESSNVVEKSQRITGDPVYTDGPLYRRVPADQFDRLVDRVPRSVVRQLESLEATASEASIYGIVQGLADSRLQSAIYDVFALLRKDQMQEALDRIKLFISEYKKLEVLSAEEVAQLADSDKIKTIPSDDPRFLPVFEHFVKSAKYLDWMLFLHPDQQDKVERDFDGASKLVGVSGSGKTCVVVKRAIRLAEKYPGAKILVLTLNRPLARLISDLVDAAALPGVRPQIEVRPFFALCQQLLHRFEPENDRLYDDRTWKSEEHIDEIWREYYRCELNNYAAEVLIPIHDSLIARGIDGEAYTREEFDWVRSAVPLPPRIEYLQITRSGRSIPFEVRYRQAILEGLDAWERKMRDVGVTDYLGLSAALCRHTDKLAPEYRCILVDESQDFGTTELAIIRHLVEDVPNNLFFCGDAAQQVSAKHQSFVQAEISVPAAHSLSIRKNYRNSRDVLAAAYAVLESNITEELLYSESFELLEPEYANFSGATPLLLSAQNIGEEIAFALGYLKLEVEGQDNKKACIAFCGYSVHELAVFAPRLGIPVLDGTITVGERSIYLADLEQTKGFEFDIVCIINCREGVMPDSLKPPREQFRDLARFYVAMTRAKYQLVLSFSGERSSLLKDVGHRFLEAKWHEYFAGPLEKSLGVPPRLDAIRRHRDEVEKSVAEMTGKEFLYSDYAIGLETGLVEKLRSTVTGRSRTLQGIPIEWKDMGSAAADFKKIPQAKQILGPVTSQQFLELCSKLGF